MCPVRKSCIYSAETTTPTSFTTRYDVRSAIGINYSVSLTYTHAQIHCINIRLHGHGYLIYKQHLQVFASCHNHIQVNQKQNHCHRMQLYLKDMLET